MSGSTSASRPSLTRELVRWFDGAVLFVFSLGAAAAYIDPTYYWLGAIIAIGLPLFGVPLLALAVALWCCRWRIAAVIHVLLVLLLLSRHASFERAFAPQPSERDLVLMTWNSPRHPESRQLGEEVAELVRSVEPHLIGLQETNIFADAKAPLGIRAHAKHRPLLDPLGYTMLVPRAVQPGRSWPNWQQPVLSRLDIDHQEQLTFQEQPDSPLLLILRTELTWQGRKLAHFNIHLFPNGLGLMLRNPSANKRLGAAAWRARVRELERSYRTRVWEVARIRELIDRETYPVILSGDLNSTPDSFVYRRLADGLQDVYRVAGSGWGATYPSKRPLLRIDFVLLGPEFEAVAGEVPPLGPRLSDHRPLVARFRWRDG